MVDGVNNMEEPISYWNTSKKDIAGPKLSSFLLAKLCVSRTCVSVFQLHSCIWLTVAKGMVCV
jgi:hypothetical protein